MTELRYGELPTAPACCPVDFSAAISEAVARTMEAASLRRDHDDLRLRYCAGTASDQDVRRYRTVRLALGLHRSPAHRPALPPAVDEALRRRAELIVELLVGPEVAGPSVAS
jgi:hypothetical protein